MKDTHALVQCIYGNDKYTYTKRLKYVSMGMQRIHTISKIQSQLH